MGRWVGSFIGVVLKKLNDVRGKQGNQRNPLLQIIIFTPGSSKPQRDDTIHGLDERQRQNINKLVVTAVAVH